jgi:hypothetical protein
MAKGAGSASLKLVMPYRLDRFRGAFYRLWVSMKVDHRGGHENKSDWGW